MTSTFYQINSEAAYPSCLKTAKVVPIFKEGDKTFPCNYRYISLVLVIGKFLKDYYRNEYLIFSISLTS